ncbi:MAG: hypothetical protein ACYS0I_09075 [Planctomycetota bacterium]
MLSGMFLSFYYTWLLDDAFVCFRYADNLLILKHGLVYNPGEYVEAYSSPAWILLLIVLRYVGLNYWTIIKIIAVIAFAAFWILLVIANRKLSQGDKYPKPLINFPLICLTFTYGVLCYFSSGTESPLTLIATAAFACLFLFPRSRLLQFMVGISPLIRHELVLPFVIVFVWCWLSERRFPFVLLFSCIATLGGWLLFRVYYYADFLPNTFYLKDEISIYQGLLFVYDTILPYQTVTVLLIFLAIYLTLSKQQDKVNLMRRQRLLMLISAVTVALYVIKIGGDPRHFRYLVFPYCLLLITTGGLLEKTFARAKCGSSVIYICAFACALFSFLAYPRQLLHHPILNIRDHREFLKINDPLLHRLRPKLTIKVLSNGSEIEPMKEMKSWLQSGRNMSSKRVVSESMCSDAYKLFDSYVINSLGLTDPFLARTQMLSDRAGHKQGLRPLSHYIVEIRKRYGFKKGAFRKAVNEGLATQWSVKNLEQIEAIERKVYNEHYFRENLSIALKPIRKLIP